MPGIKAMNIILPALLATAGAYAVPYQRRGMDQVISQCKHNFACVSPLLVISGIRHRLRTNNRG